MAATTRLRQQHAELKDGVRKLEALLSPDRLTREAAAAREALGKISGLLKVHLAVEDTALYPRLRAHGDAKVRQAAERFASEMGGLKEAFTKYVATWPSAEAVEKNAAGFVRDTRAVFDALAKRVAREESELYPLLDAMA
jgi:hemerythrin-like domain-containing protein